MNSLLVLGYVFYQGYLSRVGGIKGNRAFLLGWMGVSAVLPIIALPQFVANAAASNGITYVLPEVLTTGTSQVSSFSGYYLLAWVYAITCMVLLLNKDFHVFKIIGIIRRADAQLNYGIA